MQSRNPEVCMTKKSGIQVTKMIFEAHWCHTVNEAILKGSQGWGQPQVEADARGGVARSYDAYCDQHQSGSTV